MQEPIEHKDERQFVESESQRQEAIHKVEQEYYDILSPHYMDNERFSWAIETINKNY